MKRFAFAVADLSDPAAEPYAVVKIDILHPLGDGLMARIESLHWSRDVAEAIAAICNADPRATGFVQ